MELYLRFPNTPSWRGAQLKYRDNFTFTFTFIYSSRLNGRDYAEDLGIDGRVILEWILGK
jgi:hypothetical protein